MGRDHDLAVLSGHMDLVTDDDGALSPLPRRSTYAEGIEAGSRRGEDFDETVFNFDDGCL